MVQYTAGSGGSPVVIDVIAQRMYLATASHRTGKSQAPAISGAAIEEQVAVARRMPASTSRAMAF